MENLSKRIYENMGYPSPYRSDDALTQAVEEYVNNEEHFDRLKELNDLGIPPAVAFIALTYDQNKKLFEENLTPTKKEDKQYFGALFGAVFKNKGYIPEHDHKIYLHSASIFLPRSNDHNNTGRDSEG